MFNTYLFDDSPINSSTVPLTFSTDIIAFDSFGLQNANIITSEIDFDDTGGIELNSFKFPRENGGGVLSKFYRGRDIKLTITLKASSSSAFAALLDSFKKGLSKTEGYLDILVDTETRRIKATCTKIDFNRKHYNVTFATATVTFTALEPFFYAKNSQSFSFYSKTGTFSEEFTNGGTAASNPILYYIFSTGSAVTGVSIAAFSRTLTISNTFVNNDILIINSGTKSVTKNGVEIDYSGQFPSLNPGSCPITTTITGTALFDLTIITPKNYI